MSTPPVPADTRQVTLEAIRKSVADVLGIPLSDVSADSLLTDLGADSFHLVDLACHTEAQLGIRFPSSLSLSGRSSIAAIADAVLVHLPVNRRAASDPQSQGYRLKWL